MVQALVIASHVLRGFVHTARVELYRQYKVPYPWLRTSPMVRFKTDRSWPQPSPISPKMPSAVLHVPAEELKEFVATIVARFQRQVSRSWLDAISYLKRTPHLDCPEDDVFARHLTRSVYAYFLTDSLDDEDRRVLKENEIAPERIRKSDLTPISTVDVFAGLHCTGSVCYFREAGDGTFALVGIAMADRELRLGELIRPTDGNAWRRAKMHVLLGATYLSLFVTHPRCHFPMDSVIAVTRTCLPPEHPVAKLLEPHMYLQVPLDYSVLHIKNGPGYNDPRLYYTAFAGGGRSQYRLFETAFAGLPGHAAFEPYTFGYLLSMKRTPYLAFLAGYHAIVLRFVERVLANVELDDVVLEWARQCAHYSRGFPACTTKESLAFAVATVIWNCSIVHSADHWEFFQIPMEHKPTRLRIPAPFTREACSFEPGELTNVDDRLRQYMWHELYVRPWSLKRLSDVDYGFADAAPTEAAREFMRELHAYEATRARARNEYVPLEGISTSIQY